MEALVVGAGVIGLATAAALAGRGASVVVAEAAGRVGSGVSSRNSEVIHAGMYYEPGSLRARHCNDGRRRLYAYCRSRGIPHAKPGKLIVATCPEDEAALPKILEHGIANGTEGLGLISGADARRLEPALSCTSALLSPETGIIDAHALILALQGELEDLGGSVALLSPVTGMRRQAACWQVTIGSDTLTFDAVVNAASFGAQTLAAATEGFPPALIPRLHFAKGNYFAYRGKPPFTRLIYPVPSGGGLGVHVKTDLAGQMRFGPDVEWVETEDYTVDPARAQSFYDGIRRYFPALADGTLSPDFAGIRPKLSGPGEPAVDFKILGEREHKLPGHVALFGIDSPGLTSSLSIGEHVADLLMHTAS